MSNDENIFKKPETYCNTRVYHWFIINFNIWSENFKIIYRGFIHFAICVCECVHIDMYTGIDIAISLYKLWEYKKHSLNCMYH